jgi:RsiW-degrading membrane proteinase PrsW (M82 family)
LAFATLENANYFLKIIYEENYFTLAPVMFLRFFISTTGHIVYTGTTGYFLGLARFNPIKEKEFIKRGLALAIGIHALFNFLLFTKAGVIYLLPLILFLLWWLWKKISFLSRPQPNAEA